MNFKKCTSLVLSMAIALGVVMVKPSTSEATTEQILAGSNRYKTAIEVSKKGWNSAENVLIVNDSAIADALAATPLAEELNAPILLTGKNSLNNDTKKEIERLGAKNVYLIGGKAVLPDNLLNEIAGKKYRIAGSSREKTAIAIAEKINEVKPVKTIAVVNGKTGLADAVSIASVAAEKDMAIILSNTKEGVKDSNDFIKSSGINKSYVVGGTKAVSSSVENSLPNATRISGSNRNATNARVIEKFYTSENLNNIYVAKNGSKGENQLIDALAVGVLAAKNNSPVLIVSNNLSNEQNNVIKNKKINIVTRVGGNGNENAFNEVKELQGIKSKELKLPDNMLRTWYVKYRGFDGYTGEENRYYSYGEGITINDKYIIGYDDPIEYKVTKIDGDTYYLNLYYRHEFGDGVEKAKYVLDNNIMTHYYYENGKYIKGNVYYKKLNLPNWQMGNYYRDDNICLIIDSNKINILGKVYNYETVAINDEFCNRNIIKVNDSGENIYLELQSWGNKIGISYKYEDEYKYNSGEWHSITTFSVEAFPSYILGEIDNLLPGMDPNFNANN